MDRELLRFPLIEAIVGRRSRRFGLGMKIPSGPLAYTSPADPVPLSELERSILIASGTGVTGWSVGVPFGPDRPDEHAHYKAGDQSGLAGIVEATRACTVKIGEHRLDLPAEPPHMLEPNLWMANAPGSILFMPVGDASEQVLELMSMGLGGLYLTGLTAGASWEPSRTGGPTGSVSPSLPTDGGRFPTRSDSTDTSRACALRTSTTPTASSRTPSAPWSSRATCRRCTLTPASTPPTSDPAATLAPTRITWSTGTPTAESCPPATRASTRVRLQAASTCHHGRADCPARLRCRI